MVNTAVLQLHQRETFERNVTRALVAGAGAGVLAFLTARLNVGVPVQFLALVGATLACVRGTRLDRVMLTAMAMVLPALPYLFGFSPGWTTALAGATAGALMVKARLAEKGEEGSVGAERPGALHYVGGALLTAGLAVAGTEVASVLSARMVDLQTPVAINFGVKGVVIALFAGIGSLASHLALKSDPVEARAEELLATLSGEFATQISKALSSYRAAGMQLAALPREPAREELARTLGKLVKDAVELAGEWAGVEASVQESAHADLQKEINELQQSAASARDAVARQQLEQAASSLKEELVRLGELQLKRERVLAKLKAQVALLERARVALIGMRSSHATVRAAELSAVARKLNALALGQADEAKLAHEVATSAELAAGEVSAADATSRQQIASTSLAPELAGARATVEPIAQISAEPTETSSMAAGDEKMKN
jgi:hypothetical protein